MRLDTLYYCGPTPSSMYSCAARHHCLPSFSSEPSVEGPLKSSVPCALTYCSHQLLSVPNSQLQKPEKIGKCTNKNHWLQGQQRTSTFFVSLFGILKCHRAKQKG